jgi:broad specificity phosphatase PhoE
MIAQLAAALQQQVLLDPEIDGNHLPRLAEALLDQPEPPELTDDEVKEEWYRLPGESMQDVVVFARAVIAADRARRHG